MIYLFHFTSFRVEMAGSKQIQALRLHHILKQCKMSAFKVPMYPEKEEEKSNFDSKSASKEQTNFELTSSKGAA